MLTKALTMLCLCALLLNPVPRKWFDLVSKHSGVQFDYDNQTDHDTVRRIFRDNLRGGE